MLYVIEKTADNGRKSYAITEIHEENSSVVKSLDWLTKKDILNSNHPLLFITTNINLINDNAIEDYELSNDEFNNVELISIKEFMKYDMYKDNEFYQEAKSWINYYSFSNQENHKDSIKKELDKLESKTSKQYVKVIKEELGLSYK